MKNLILYFGIIIFSLPQVYSEKDSAPILSGYQKKLISYFKEIALGFEYGSASQITRKWKSNMKIFVGGTPNEALELELQSLVKELNELVTDGFAIEIVGSQVESNFYVFFGTANQYASLYPRDADLVSVNSGAYRIYWNERNEIINGHMYVNLRKTSLKEQKSVLREELTQSLGLGNDSPKYADSIFQSEWSTPLKYSAIDKDVIRLLYHPNMLVGLTAEQTETLLKEILLAESGV